MYKCLTIDVFLRFVFINKKFLEHKNLIKILNFCVLFECHLKKLNPMNDY